MTAMPAMFSMFSMHEQVHERAQEKGQPNQRAQDMRAVFGEQKRAGDGEKAKQHETRARSQKAPGPIVAAVRSVLKRHDAPCFQRLHDERPGNKIQRLGVFDRVRAGREPPTIAPRASGADQTLDSLSSCLIRTAFHLVS